MEAATEAATHLYNKGEGQWGTCEEAFIELLCACSPVQNKVRVRVGLGVRGRDRVS